MPNILSALARFGANVTSAPFAHPLLMVIVVVDFVAVLRGYRPVGRWEHVERTLTSVPG